MGLSSKLWQLFEIQLLNGLGHVNGSLTFRRLNTMEELRSGEGDLDVKC